jgi:putative membrane protein insertion efficiency factor
MQTSPSSSSSFDGALPERGVVRVNLASVVLWPPRFAAGLVVLVLLFLIWVYQRTLSPLLRPCCRFSPSCSEYATEALRKYGLVKGFGKSVWRLARCHPFCRGGYDAP